MVSNIACDPNSVPVRAEAKINRSAGPGAQSAKNACASGGGPTLQRALLALSCTLRHVYYGSVWKHQRLVEYVEVVITF